MDDDAYRVLGLLLFSHVCRKQCRVFPWNVMIHRNVSVVRLQMRYESRPKVNVSNCTNMYASFYSVRMKTLVYSFLYYCIYRGDFQSKPLPILSNSDFPSTSCQIEPMACFCLFHHETFYVQSFRLGLVAAPAAALDRKDFTRKLLYDMRWFVSTLGCTQYFVYDLSGLSQACILLLKLKSLTCIFCTQRVKTIL